MPIGIRELSPGDRHAFECIVALYREAIELSEQRPEAELRALLSRHDYQVLAAERDGAVAAFAISYVPSDRDFWLFEYAATLPLERGQGIGARLFRQAGVTAGKGRIGLVEVDSESDGAHEAAGRRLRFYARLGCRVVRGLNYLLPLRTHGVPPPMLLLALAPSGMTNVPRDAIERWLRLLYVDVYYQNADDPRIAEMVRGLPYEVKLAEIQPSPGRATP